MTNPGVGHSSIQSEPGNLRSICPNRFLNAPSRAPGLLAQCRQLQSSRGEGPEHLWFRFGHGIDAPILRHCVFGCRILTRQTLSVSFSCNQSGEFLVPRGEHSERSHIMCRITKDMGPSNQLMAPRPMIAQILTLAESPMSPARLVAFQSR